MSKVYLHPLPLRIWHWANALIIIVLIITGMQLRIPHIAFFADYRYAVSIHKYMGFILGGSFLFWFGSYVFIGGLKRQYLLTLRDIGNMPKQVCFYLYDLFRGRENPFKPTATHKFNPLQKTAYFFIMFVSMPVIIASGILFSDIFYFLKVVDVIGGVRILDAAHVIFAYLFVIYLVVHIYMSTLGKRPYTHIKTMMVGYEDEDENHQNPHAEGDSAVTEE